MTEVARRFRKEPTPGEALLWQALRNRRLGGRKFRRQQPIGPFVVDFYCAEERLVIEVDGPVHLGQGRQDRDRQRLLESLGLRFLRLKTDEIENSLASALERICAAFRGPVPLSRAGRGGRG